MPSWATAATSPTHDSIIETSSIDISITAKMKTLSIGLLTLTVWLAAAQDDCPDIPENDVEIGEPVPMNPNDIPEGCSAYEVLVGKLFSFAHYVPAVAHTGA